MEAEGLGACARAVIRGEDGLQRKTYFTGSLLRISAGICSGKLKEGMFLCFEQLIFVFFMCFEELISEISENLMVLGLCASHTTMLMEFSICEYCSEQLHFLKKLMVTTSQQSGSPWCQAKYYGPMGTECD
ncbi:hypothetical protein AgCh_026540 [Apium graveolens]